MILGLLVLLLGCLVVAGFVYFILAESGEL